jgi:hypothetical protein
VERLFFCLDSGTADCLLRDDGLRRMHSQYVASAASGSMIPLHRFVTSGNALAIASAQWQRTLLHLPLQAPRLDLHGPVRHARRAWMPIWRIGPLACYTHSLTHTTVCYTHNTQPHVTHMLHVCYTHNQLGASRVTHTTSVNTNGAKGVCV